MKKILYYRLDETEQNVYPKLLKRLGYQMLACNDNDLDTTLEELFLREESSIGSCERFEHSYFIMSGMTKEDLQVVLDAFQTAKLPYKGIKVMRTETNAKWTLRELFAETASEHEMFQNVKLLDQLIRSCNVVDITLMEENEREKFKQVLMDAFILLKSGMYTNEELQEAIRNLKDVLMLVKRPMH